MNVDRGSVGANHVIDYTKEAFTHQGQRYDVIVDTVGNAPLSRYMASLKKAGRLVALVAGLPEMVRAPFASIVSEKKIIAGPASGGLEALRFLADLAEQGAFRPVIDRCYPCSKSWRRTVT